MGIGGVSGVQGQTTVASSVGVSGFGGNDGDGVFGTAGGNLGYGVTGIVTTGNGQIGVFGEAASGGATRYGGFFNNDLGTTGTKTFMIDHPMDPGNKFLKHFSMESPEILNLYRGNAVLDAAGEAVISLPSYFETVNNTNYSYYLTPVGGQAQLYVKTEIQNKQFIVAGGTPGMKVSWMVFAERNDPYMQQNPDERMVEIPKTGTQSGKYLNPQLFGQPKESGIFSSKNRQIKADIKEITNEEVTPVNKSIELKTGGDE